MTAAPPDTRARRLQRDAVPRLVELLETDFGRAERGQGILLHQHLLSALDRGEHHRFVAAGGDEPVGVVFEGASGTLVPAGLDVAGPVLAETVERIGWRVLIGPHRVTGLVLGRLSRGLFRRRPGARVQHLMAADAATVTSDGVYPSLRRACPGDVEFLTEFACGLHVEDRMGPPIPPSARGAVRARVRDAIVAQQTWVVDHGGGPIAKIDVSLSSRLRGAQISGVYVSPPERRGGIGGDAVAALAARLLREGVPAVTLHVRADNAVGLRAYSRAGFASMADLLLALR